MKVRELFLEMFKRNLRYQDWCFEFETHKLTIVFEYVRQIDCKQAVNVA